ncbi:hypothetical protein M8J76_016838 [Diaphorina citri]|nr:hypothetical protein M8J75_003842 [Diaphorina citri]KAI5749002.1 hypothetical protein M8J76_003909 [Diaphorina citri]KAI5750579.1 hypothetical protein M8J76_016838 [Diaphorina citri]KAI5755148.1 hypothetical protein M8J77_014528 [Diaphorina citri]
MTYQIEYKSQSGPGGAPTQGFLSLVSLSTTPPQVCTGVGATIEQSQTEAAVSALQFISDMGLQSMSPLRTGPSSQQTNKSINNRLFPLNNGGPPGTPPFTAYNNHSTNQQNNSANKNHSAAKQNHSANKKNRAPPLVSK